jgi:glycosyltransferase involved in cell wall biosynthesis
MTKLSATIITYNEEAQIGRCLSSLRDVADEIVVVDSLSADRTKEICLSHGVTFIEQPFLGYIQQKNFALSKANYPFVLSLDADEALSDALITAIKKEKALGFPADGYSMNRFNNYCGAWIKHGDYYPDRKLRLWNCKKGSWGGENPHDKVILVENTSVKHLDGDLLHYSFKSIEGHWQQMGKFSTIAAQAMYQKGKKAGMLRPVISAVWTFLRGYIIRGGFLDGSYGFTIARINAWYTFQKYQKLIRLYENGKNG